MSGGAIIVTTVLGSIGYLLVGWLTVIVVAARCAYGDGDIPSLAWAALPFWPLVFPVALVWVCVGPIDRATKRAVRHLNPNATGKWF